MRGVRALPGRPSPPARRMLRRGRGQVGLLPASGYADTVQEALGELGFGPGACCVLVVRGGCLRVSAWWHSNIQRQDRMAGWAGPRPGGSLHWPWQAGGASMVGRPGRAAGGSRGPLPPGGRGRAGPLARGGRLRGGPAGPVHGVAGGPVAGGGTWGCAAWVRRVPLQGSAAAGSGVSAGCWAEGVRGRSGSVGRAFLGAAGRRALRGWSPMCLRHCVPAALSGLAGAGTTLGGGGLASGSAVAAGIPVCLVSSLGALLVQEQGRLHGLA